MSAANRSLRNALGQFASGVTVVAAQDGKAVHGATVSSFTSVSLQPPLVMVSLDRRSRMCALLRDGSSFGVNVLAAGQRGLALRFAGMATDAEPDVAWTDQGPAPRLAGVAAHFTCTSWAAYDGGDHVLYVGEVQDHSTATGGEPLVFHRGAF
uniref:flavin reductase family protein n=1 Tax=Streptomyces sp. NPDC047097 TaxID=3155260 RepID=UPI0033DBECDB